MATGVISGGIVTKNGMDADEFDVSAGTGVVVNNYTNPNDPTLTPTSWPGSSGVALDDITEEQTYVGVNAAGTLIQQPDEFTPIQKRTIIPLAKIEHPDHTEIESVLSMTTPAFDVMLQTADFLQAFGNFNISGNNFTANGANLHIDKDAGKVYVPTIGYPTDRRSPSIKNTSPETESTFIYSYRSAVPGVWTHTVSTDIIDPDQYDDGDGTLAAVLVGKFTIQMIFYEPYSAVHVIQYGQTYYDSIPDAQAAVTVGVDMDPYVDDTLFRTWLIVKVGTTHLNDGAFAYFAQAGRFGVSTIVAGAGGGESNTASNVGLAGVGPFLLKAGIDLEFKNIAAASSKVDVSDNVPQSTVDIDVVEANLDVGAMSGTITDAEHGVRTTAQHPDVVGGLSGSLTDAQHGVLVTAGQHPDIVGGGSGVLTNTQHGVRTTAQHPDVVGGLSGSLTDAQHGVLVTAGQHPDIVGGGSGVLTNTQHGSRTTAQHPDVVGGLSGTLAAGQFSDISHGVRSTVSQHPDVVGGASGTLTDGQHGVRTTAGQHPDIVGGGSGTLAAGQFNDTSHGVRSTVSQHPDVVGGGSGTLAAGQFDNTSHGSRGAGLHADSHTRLHAVDSALDHSAGTQGNIPYAGAVGAWSLLAPGTAGQVLKTQGAAANPQWGNALTQGNRIIIVAKDGTGNFTTIKAAQAAIGVNPSYPASSTDQRYLILVMQAADGTNTTYHEANPIPWDKEFVQLACWGGPSGIKILMDNDDDGFVITARKCAFDNINVQRAAVSTAGKAAFKISAAGVGDMLFMRCKSNNYDIGWLNTAGENRMVLCVIDGGAVVAGAGANFVKVTGGMMRCYDCRVLAPVTISSYSFYCDAGGLILYNCEDTAVAPGAGTKAGSIYNTNNGTVAAFNSWLSLGTNTIYHNSGYGTRLVGCYVTGGTNNLRGAGTGVIYLEAGTWLSNSITYDIVQVAATCAIHACSTDYDVSKVSIVANSTTFRTNEIQERDTIPYIAGSWNLISEMSLQLSAQSVVGATTRDLTNMCYRMVFVNVTTKNVNGTLRLTAQAGGGSYDPVTNTLTALDTEDIAVTTTGWFVSTKRWYGTVRLSAVGGLNIIIDGYKTGRADQNVPFILRSAKFITNGTGGGPVFQVVIEKWAQATGVTTVWDSNTVLGTTVVNGQQITFMRDGLNTTFNSDASLPEFMIVRFVGLNNLGAIRMILTKELGSF